MDIDQTYVLYAKVIFNKFYLPEPEDRGTGGSTNCPNLTFDVRRANLSLAFSPLLFPSGKACTFG